MESGEGRKEGRELRMVRFVADVSAVCVCFLLQVPPSLISSLSSTKSSRWQHEAGHIAT